MTRFNQTKCKKMLAIGFAAALLGSMGGHNSVLEAAVPDKVVSGVPAAEQNAKTQMMCYCYLMDVLNFAIFTKMQRK